MIWVAAILIIICGLYSVGTVGVTGGPNKGEHPFTVTMVHMPAFAYFGSRWPALSRHLYWGGLVAALVLSIIALRLTHSENPNWKFPVRVFLSLLYAGFVFILITRP